MRISIQLDVDGDRVSVLSCTADLPVLGGEEVRRGRPLDRDRDKSCEATKPWLLEGMSRRTWYRRKKVSRETLR